jgi:predicted RNA-binding protein with PUA-like domain
MKNGDLVLYYHSGALPEVVGTAKVVKGSYQDPTTDDERWVAVDLEPVKPLKRPVALGDIKNEKRLKDISLIKQGRLSVMPVTKEEYDVILGMGSG